MQMDSERMAARKKLGLDLMPIVDQLKMYYGHNSTETITSTPTAPRAYKDIVGHNVRSRYLTEDVPSLWSPASSSEKAGYPMPVVDLVIRMASLHDTDYAAEGTRWKNSASTR